MPDYNELLKGFLANSQQNKEATIGENVETFRKLDTKYQPTSRTTDPYEFAALNQTKLESGANMVAKALSTTGTTAVGTLASVYDIPRAILTSGQKDGGWNYFFNNSLLNDLNKFNQKVAEEFPVYQTYAQQQDIFNTENILDNTLQGLGFIGGAYLGGGLLSSIGKGLNLSNQLSKVINSTKAVSSAEAAESQVAANYLKNKFIDNSKNLVSSIYNRVPESAIEAFGTGEELKQRLLSERDQGLNQLNDEEINQQVLTAQKLNFAFNLGLGSIDAIQNAKIFKNFSSSLQNSTFGRFDDILTKYKNNKTSLLGKSTAYTGKAINYLTTGGGLPALLEGVEELAQYSSNKLAKDIATQNPDISIIQGTAKMLSNILPQMGKDITTDNEAQLSALIGTLVGLPLSAIATRNDIKQKGLYKIYQEEKAKKVQELANKTNIDLSEKSGLLKVKYGNDPKVKAQGTTEVRFAQNKDFQYNTLLQIQAGKFDDYISRLEDLSNTSEEELNQQGINLEEDSNGQKISPQNVIQEAIKAAKDINSQWKKLDYLYGNLDSDVKLSLSGVLADASYIDKQIDKIANSLSQAKLTTLTPIFSYPTGVYIKATNKNDIFRVTNPDKNIGNITLEDIKSLDIDPIKVKEIEHLTYELEALQALREYNLEEYNRLNTVEGQQALKKKLEKNKSQIEDTLENIENTQPEQINKSEPSPNITPTEKVVSEASNEVSETISPTSVPDENGYLSAFEITKKGKTPIKYQIFEDQDEYGNVSKSVRVFRKLPKTSYSTYSEKEFIEKFSTEDYQEPIEEPSKEELPPIDSIPEVTNLNLGKYYKSVDDTGIINQKYNSNLSDYTNWTNGESPDPKLLFNVKVGDKVLLRKISADSKEGVNYPFIGIYNTDNQLMSIMRITYSNDELATKKANELLKSIDNKTMEYTLSQGNIEYAKINDDFLSVPVNLENIKDSNLFDIIDKKVINNRVVPTIVRVLGKDSLKVEVVTGNLVTEIDTIRIPNFAKSGDTFVLSTRKDIEGKQALFPLGVKTLGEVESTKNDITNIFNEFVDKTRAIKSDKSKDAKSKRDTVWQTYIDDFHTKLSRYIQYSTPTSTREVSLKMIKNNLGEVVLEFKTNFNQPKATLINLLNANEGELTQLLNDILNIKPSLEVNALTSKSTNEGQLSTYDSIKDYLTTKIDPNRPVYGLSINIDNSNIKEQSKPKVEKKVGKPTAEEIEEDNSIDLEQLAQLAKPRTSGRKSTKIGKESTAIKVDEVFLSNQLNKTTIQAEKDKIKTFVNKNKDLMSANVIEENIDNFIRTKEFPC